MSGDEFSLVLWLVSIILIVVLFIRTSKLEEKIRRLESGSRVTPPPGESIKQPAAVEKKDTDRKPEKQPAEVDTNREQKPTTAEVQRPAAAVKTHPPLKKETTAHLFKFEKNFIEKYTGILGALITVLGFAFLGIYGALNLPPAGRTGLLVLTTLLILGVSFFLKRYEKFTDTADWLQSAAAALLLFTAYAAGNIKDLQVIESRTVMIAVLAVAVAINLAAGFLRRRRLFTALHHAYAVIVLAAAGPDSAVLITAVLTGIITVLYLRLTKTDSDSAYAFSSVAAVQFFYQIWWYFSAEYASLSEPGIEIYTAILSAYFMAAAVMITSSEHSGIVAIFNRGSAWLLMMLPGILYWPVIAPLMPVKGAWPAFLLPGIIALAYSYFFTRSFSARLSDRIAAMFLFLIAVATSQQPVQNEPLLALLAFLSVSVIQTNVKSETGKQAAAVDLLVKITSVLRYIAAFIFFIILINTDPVTIQNPVLAMAGLVTVGVFHLIRNFHSSADNPEPGFVMSLQNNKFKISSESLTVFLMLLAVALTSLSLNYAGPSVLTALLLGVIGTKLFDRELKYFTHGIMAAVPLIFLIHWGHYYEIDPGTAMHLSAGSLFLVCAVFTALALFKNNTTVFNTVIYLTVTHTALYAGAAVEQNLNLLLSLFLAGEIMLIAATVTIEKISTSALLKQSTRHLQTASYIFFTVFFVNWLRLDHGEEAALFSAFNIFALLAVTVLIGGYIFKPQRFFTAAREIRLELILLIFVITVYAAVPAVFLPALLMATAIIAYTAGSFLSPQAARLQLYSIGLHLFAALLITTVSTEESVHYFWHQKPQTGGLFALGFMLVYMITFNRFGGLNRFSDTFKDRLQYLEGAAAVITRRQNAVVYYGFFIALALFLTITAEKTVLTLLWSAEAFMIFLLGILLKENHFRYIATGALVLCLVRLVFFDLVQSSTLTRALVFTGVGLMLLAMNLISQKWLPGTDENTDNQA